MDIEQEAAVGSSEVVKTMLSGEVQPLDDLHSIESVLFFIKDFNERIVDYKKLKKKRAQSIEQQIENAEQKIEFFKSLIIATLRQHKQKKVRFPGVGTVSDRKPKAKFVIEDEEALIEYLHEVGEYEAVTEEETNMVIKKHELNKLLSLWAKNDELPDCVKDETPKESITVKLESDIEDGDRYVDEIDEIDNLDFS